MNKEEISQYINERLADNDYASIAQVYRNITPRNAEERRQFNEYADQLERFGGIAQSMKANAKTEEDVNMLNFYFQTVVGGRPSGEIGEQYVNSLNKTSKDNSNFNIFDPRYTQPSSNEKPKIDYNKNISYVDYEFKNNEDYAEFLERSGYNFSEKDLNNPTKPYIYKDKKGQTILRIDNSNYNNYEFFNKINNSINDMQDWLFSIPTMSNYKRVTSKVYDEKGTLIESKNGIPSSHRNALDLYNKAKEVYDKQLENLNSNKTFEVLVSNYMCYGEKQLQDDMFKGTVSKEQATALTKRWDDFFKSNLESENFNSYDVYTNIKDTKTHNFNKIDDEEKYDFANKLHKAIKDGRATWKAASMGGESGTYITIAPETIRDGGTFVFDTGVKQAIEAFIPKKFAEYADKTIDNDLNHNSLKKYYDHMIYGYDVKTADGGKITNITKDGGVYIKDGISHRADSKEIMNAIKEKTYIDATLQYMEETHENELYDNSGKIKSLKDLLQNDEFVKEISNHATAIYFGLNNIQDEKELTKPNTKNEINNIVDIIINNILNNK